MPSKLAQKVLKRTALSEDFFSIPTPENQKIVELLKNLQIEPFTEESVADYSHKIIWKNLPFYQKMISLLRLIIFIGFLLSAGWIIVDLISEGSIRLVDYIPLTFFFVLGIAMKKYKKMAKKKEERIIVFEGERIERQKIIKLPLTIRQKVLEIIKIFPDAQFNIEQAHVFISNGKKSYKGKLPLTNGDQILVLIAHDGPCRLKYLYLLAWNYQDLMSD